MDIDISETKLNTLLKSDIKPTNIRMPEALHREMKAIAAHEGCELYQVNTLLVTEGIRAMREKKREEKSST